MIYITGDTHGNIDFQKLKRYFNNRYSTTKDYLIILGDAGIVWSEEDCYISDYNYIGPTVLFIDGNHENFELLNKYPVVQYKGAKCHRLSKNVYHIFRGEIININNLSFFCMGGATSIDKAYRQNRITWWKEENISYSDIENALENLKKIKYRVDYVLSHCAPSNVVKKMFGYETDSNTEILQQFQSKISFDYWFFGHYHSNKKIGKYRCFYGDILEIPAMDVGTRKFAFDYLYSDKDGNLHNRKTGRKIKARASDLPEWYFEGYNGYYFSLKDVTDTAFHRSCSDNHLDKDAAVYLHYHGKLKKQPNYEPQEEDKWEKWDASSWRDSCRKICLGVEKYTPNLDLKKLKAAINLNYDQYNNRWEFVNDSIDRDIVVRPFPEIETPHYQERYDGDIAEYAVYKGDVILTEYIKKSGAIKYAKKYIELELGLKHATLIDGDENSDFVVAFDIGYGLDNAIFIKKINYEK